MIGHEPLDFDLRHDAKMAVSIRQCQTEAERSALQPAVVIALPTDAHPFLNERWKRSLKVALLRSH